MQMKKCFIIFNVIFFLFGNVLISNAHHLIHHHHDVDFHNEYDCQECLILQSNNDCVEDSNESFFISNNISDFISSFTVLIDFDVYQTYCSRAPPTSL